MANKSKQFNKVVYQLVLFDENCGYVFDGKMLERALRAFHKYKTGDPEADRELLDDLLKNVRKYKIVKRKNDVGDIVEILEYQYNLW